MASTSTDLLPSELKEIIQWLKIPEIEILLNGNNFNQLYSSFITDNRIPQKMLSWVLLDAGVNPIPYLTLIGKEMFRNCDTLVDVKLNPSVTTIGYQAFRNCNNLKSITLPATLSSIGARAFISCPNLTDIYYSGTESQFIEIWKRTPESNSTFDPNMRVEIHCDDGNLIWKLKNVE